MTTSLTSLDDRYNAVHDAILAGPNAELQGWIDSGLAWQLEGFVGRTAADALASGAVVLPPEPRRDYWGSMVPSYYVVEDRVGSPGSVANAEAFDQNTVDEWNADTHW